MKIIDFLKPQAVTVGFKASSKKALLQFCASCLARQADKDERVIYDLLRNREKLGSTAIGGGVAIPHASLKELSAPILCFIILDEAIDYQAPDDLPVDLVAALLAPCDGGSEHLKALSHMSHILRDADMRSRLRGSDNSDAAYVILTDDPKNERAA